MVSYFTGGAIGTTVGTYSWSVAGWTGVCVSEGLFLVAAVVLWALADGREVATEVRQLRRHPELEDARLVAGDLIIDSGDNVGVGPQRRA